MSKLTEAREIINRIDGEMRTLFEERMRAAEMVAEYKIEHALPTYDAEREQALIERNCEGIKDPTVCGYYVQFLQNLMKLSRDYQDKIRNGMKVAYSGVEGAFAHIASGKIFPTATLVAYPDFKSAYNSVASGESDCAVLPIENSTAGEVGSVFDMLFSGSLYISGVYDLFIDQHLMAKKGTSLSDVRRVISHPQALMQCAEFIKSHKLEQVEFENTARAAKFVAESADSQIAAIASLETAELYGLEILSKNINEKNMNTTRFATVCRAKSENPTARDRHSIMMFTVSNDAGSLAHAINIIGKYDFNMRCIRSRPMKELLWQYYFYVEAEGNLDSDKGKAMLKELSECCDKLKVLGTFKYPCKLT